ncbi:acetylxylan esterase [candidate division KSB1 bacterium]|nr:acetylxylan esterase [candidate division KSB1 bacterium]
MPLQFDMPLDQLEHYAGSNPCPDDFNDFWERSLADLESVDPQPEQVAADFQCDFADCFHLYFTGIGGARIHAKLIRPRRAASPHPAVLLFHGYYGHSGDWMSKLGYTAQGMTVAALDCRGQGGRSQDIGGVNGWTLRGHIVRGLADGADNLLFRQIFLDTAQLARVVGQLDGVDPERIGATGASQGGGLTLACAALVPQIRRAAPVFPFLCDYRRTWEIDLATHAYEELSEYFKKFDPMHDRETDIFTHLGYIDVQFLCPRIRAEVLMGVGLMDRICPPSTQFAAYNKIRSKKSLALYPDFGHEELPGHSDRIFQFLCGL